MATAKETIEAALRGDGCLGKAALDEPVFVLRAQDKLAPLHVEDWADDAESAGAPVDKVEDSRRIAIAMREWGRKHGTKYPD